MALTAMLQRRGDGFYPVEDVDRQYLDSYKEGQPTLFAVKKVSHRVMERHRLYWGGLVKLVANHWEPRNGLVLKTERSVLNKMIDFVAHMGQPTDALTTLTDAFIEHRVTQAKALYHEQKAKDVLENIHEWLKEESGYFDYVVTPTGVKRRIKSISFEKMKTQEEFEEFYSKAFDVAWRYVLTNVGYKSQEEAQNVALQMMMMR